MTGAVQLAPPASARCADGSRKCVSFFGSTPACGRLTAVGIPSSLRGRDGYPRGVRPCVRVVRVVADAQAEATGSVQCAQRAGFGAASGEGALRVAERGAADAAERQREEQGGKQREASSGSGEGNAVAAEEGARNQSAGSGSGGSEDRVAGSKEGAEWEQRGLYTKFVEHCSQEMGKRMALSPFSIREDWQVLRGQDGAAGTPAVCRSVADSSAKIRFVRSADISCGKSLQVLNLVAFPRPSYDLPFFCADLVTFPRGHLVVIDVNPLYHTQDYFDKYIAKFMPLCNKYNKLLPWGGEFTSESLQFFSPALLWSRFPLDHNVANGPVFDAFADYLQVWLGLVEECEEETDPAAVESIREAQHRYMCWRAEKDPGRPVLTRLFGADRCEDYIHNFLFHGLTTLGSRTFLDYFPQYRLPDGSTCRKRSMAGKSYTVRPWDDHGRLVLQPHPSSAAP